jgi:hypothetical protein
MTPHARDPNVGTSYTLLANSPGGDWTGTQSSPVPEPSTWDYPTDVPAFLAAIGTSVDDPHDAKLRVGLFMMTRRARQMPSKLRTALRDAGLIAVMAGPIPIALTVCAAAVGQSIGPLPGDSLELLGRRLGAVTPNSLGDQPR